MRSIRITWVEYIIQFCFILIVSSDCRTDVRHQSECLESFVVANTTCNARVCVTMACIRHSTIKCVHRMPHCLCPSWTLNNSTHPLWPRSGEYYLWSIQVYDVAQKASQPHTYPHAACLCVWNVAIPVRVHTAVYTVGLDFERNAWIKNESIFKW